MAQSGRASRLGREGRKFESCISDHTLLKRNEMFKVDLKTGKVENNDKPLPTVEELMPNPNFKIIVKKKSAVKSF